MTALSTSIVVLATGAFVFVLLLLQVSIGMRWIKLKGRRHWTVHKWIAWSIVALAAVHLVIALMYLGLFPAAS